MADKVVLACAECGRRNYSVRRNRTKTERMELKKFCKYCKAHTIHRETK